MKQQSPNWKVNLVDMLGLREYIITTAAFRPPTPPGYVFEVVENHCVFAPILKGKVFQIQQKQIQLQAYQVTRKQGCCPLIYLRPNHEECDMVQYRSQSHDDMKMSSRKKDTQLFKSQAQNFGKVLIIYSHGNASDLGDVYFFGEAVCIEFGVDFLAYDYSGYGRNNQRLSPSEKQTYNDLQSVLAFAVGYLGYALDQIILWGYSLGSGPTCELATRFTQIGGVILQAPLASIYHWVDDHSPFEDGFSNVKKIHAIKAKILIIHGERDVVIPIRQSEILVERYTSVTGKSINFCRIPDVGHHDMHEVILDPFGESGNQIYQMIKQVERNCRRSQSRVIPDEAEYYQQRETELLKLIDQELSHQLKRIDVAEVHYTNFKGRTMSAFQKDQELTGQNSMFALCTCQPE